MTKKDYELIARGINRYAKENYSFFPEWLEELCQEFCQDFEQENPRFNRDKFLAACRGE